MIGRPYRSRRITNRWKRAGGASVGPASQRGPCRSRCERLYGLKNYAYDDCMARCLTAQNFRGGARSGNPTVPPTIDEITACDGEVICEEHPTKGRVCRCVFATPRSGLTLLALRNRVRRRARTVRRGRRPTAALRRRN